MQQHELNTTLFLDALATSLGETLTAMNARVRALEAAGELTVLDSIPDEAPRVATLARHKNGLFQYTGDRWRVIANSIDQVEAVPTPDGVKLMFTRSTGDIFEAGEIKFPKPSRRKAIKAESLDG